jgi:hypothetical protein
MLKFCFFAALALLAHEPKTITGKVVAIADGDTLTVLDTANTQHKIRLHGIDAPEKGQAFGTKARENLAAKVFGKIVRVEVVDVDRYNARSGESTSGNGSSTWKWSGMALLGATCGTTRRLNSPMLSARPERNAVDFGRTRIRSRRGNTAGRNEPGPVPDSGGPPSIESPVGASKRPAVAFPVSRTSFSIVRPNPNADEIW